MIGESNAARIQARGAVTGHARPLGADAEFIEFVLDTIRREIGNGGLQDGSPVTFVFYRYFGIVATAIPFGPKVDLPVVRPQAGTVYVSSEGLRTSYIVMENGASLAAHEAAIAQRLLQDDTRVTFEPVSGRVIITCRELGPAPLVMQLASGQFDWSPDRLEETVDSFHDRQLDNGLGLILSGNGGLQINAVSVYRNALYMYLKFEIGLDGDHGYRVATNDDSVVVRRRRDEIAVLAACGIRAGLDLPTEVIRLDAIIEDKRQKVADGGLTRMRLNCLACQSAVAAQGVDPDSAEPFLLRHHHVCEVA